MSKLDNLSYLIFTSFGSGSIFGILDPDPHENLCGSEKLPQTDATMFAFASFPSFFYVPEMMTSWGRQHLQNMVLLGVTDCLRLFKLEHWSRRWAGGMRTTKRTKARSRAVDPDPHTFSLKDPGGKI